MIVWADGRLVAADQAVYRADDPVPTVGLGLFETCLVVDGRVRWLDRHLARLDRSAAALGLEVEPDAVHAGVTAVLAVAASGSHRLRITAGSPAGPVVTLVGLDPRDPPRVRRSAWVRNERSPLTGHKSTSYAADALALAEARRHGADEALLADSRGRLSEGATSNVWVEIDGELLTPSLVSGCLPGIQREVVLELAAAEGLPVREAELPWSVLDRVVSGEAGLAVSNALRGLVPVAALDGEPVRPTPLIATVRELIGLA